MKRDSVLKYAIPSVLVCIALPLQIAYSRTASAANENASAAFENGHAQSAQPGSDADDPKFAKFVYEVVSIKPYKEDPNAKSRWMGTQDSPDSFTLHNAPLSIIIAQAYRTEHSKLGGAPDWLNNERYEVEAKMEPEVADALQKLSPQDKKLARQHMLRALAKEYLKVTIHMEATEVSIFDLVVGKNGSKLKASDPNAPEGGLRVSGTGGATQWEGKSTMVSSMMGQLSYVMGRPVYDKTGLTGRYDFTLKYAPDRTAAAGPGTENDAPTVDAPSITTAFEEQLGLKLVSGKGPMDVIVIDHVERPSVN